MSFTEIKNAIKKHKLQAVKALVEANPEIVNITNESGEIPLFVALREERADIFKYLVDKGSNIEHKNTKSGSTVLHLVCQLTNLDIYRILSDNSADIEVTNDEGETPLYIACEHGHHREATLELISDLLDTAEEQEDSEEYEDIYEREMNKYINKKSGKGYFPLYVACIKGDNDIVKLLLKRGAMVQEFARGGTTSLMAAVQLNKNSDRLEIIKTLLENDAYDNPEDTDNEGHTVLYYAEKNGDAKVIELLEQYRPSPSSSSSPSKSPSKSKSFSVGIVEPAVLDVVEINKSQIPETAEDFINMIPDQNIAEFLEENAKNKIIKIHNSFYAVGGEDIKTHYLTGNQKNKYVYYPCKRALPPPALSVNKTDVHMDKPLFSASYLGPIADFVLLDEVIAMLESENKYFEIFLSGSEVQDIPATATAQMFTSQRNAVGANHCQEGKAAKIFKLKMLNIVEPAVLAEEPKKSAAKKRRTRKARVKTFHLKQGSVKKRKAVNDKSAVKKRKTVNTKISVKKRKTVDNKKKKK